MSVIQRIQDRYAKLMAIVIAVALMIFVVMLAFENGGRLFSGNSTTVGKVNGHTIEYTDFVKKVDQAEKTMEAQGGGSGAQLQQQAVEAVWNNEVDQALQNSELSKLGIKVGKREMGDILYGANPPDDLKRIFTDTATGMYNGQLAKQQIDAAIRIKKGTAEQLEQRERLIAFIDYQENTRLKAKYNSLLTNSINYAKWFVEKQIADNSQMASVSLVRSNYASSTDSTIKVTDNEIMDYLDKHKQEYKAQMNESRSIAYVAFSTRPTAADSSAARNKLMDLKAKFDSATDLPNFFASQSLPFYNTYLNDSAIQIRVKDSIFKMPIGGIYGPYVDGSGSNAVYTLAKLLGVRNQPDTVKVRHILIGTSQRDPQTGEAIPTRDSATARKLVDSIQLAIQKGSSFDSLLKFSDDNPNMEQLPRKLKGGIYDKIASGQMVAEFNEFIFSHPVGAKGVVKTDFGFHYIEILAQKGSSKAYKIAYLPKPIETSTETEVNASNEASKFAGDSRDQKSFDANADKLQKERGINKGVAGDILPSSYSVGGLGQSRALVKSIYRAKVGDVLEPEKIGDSYVVAIVTEATDEGTMSITKARPLILPILRNKKIADKLKQKLGTISTLEAASSAFGGAAIEVIDSIRMTGSQTGKAMAIGGEPKVIGAAFNPSNKGKVVPESIAGRGGVFVVRVDNETTTPVSDANVADQRKSRYQLAKQTAAYRQTALAILKESANIKDERIKFF